MWACIFLPLPCVKQPCLLLIRVHSRLLGWRLLLSPGGPWTQGAPNAQVAAGACASPWQEHILFGDQKLTLQGPALWEREVKSPPPSPWVTGSDSQGTTLASTLGSWIPVLLGAHIISSVLHQLLCGTLQHPVPALLDGVVWGMGSGRLGPGLPPTPLSLRSGPLVRCCGCGISCL